MKDREIQACEHYLKPGHIFLSRKPFVISAVLGSCVAVTLWDKKGTYGGMAHFLYPSIREKEKSTAQYGNVAVLHLVKMLLDEGTNKKNMNAQIFGGAALPSLDCSRIARENIRVARNTLMNCGIKVISEDVGGNVGRKLVYNTLTNEAIIYRANKLRKGDWYPYVDEDR
jgi:chemotaxis protein CheD